MKELFSLEVIRNPINHLYRSGSACASYGAKILTLPMSIVAILFIARFIDLINFFEQKGQTNESSGKLKNCLSFPHLTLNLDFWTRQEISRKPYWSVSAHTF